MSQDTNYRSEIIGRFNNFYQQFFFIISKLGTCAIHDLFMMSCNPYNVAQNVDKLWRYGILILFINIALFEICLMANLLQYQAEI